MMLSKKFVSIVSLGFIVVCSGCFYERGNRREIYAYFEALEDSGYQMPCHESVYMPEGACDSIWKSIFLMQLYRNGTLDKYPDKEVNYTLDLMYWGVSEYMIPESLKKRWGDSMLMYFEKYQEKAYEVAPDIDTLADAVADDSCWAVRFYGFPIGSYIFYKDNEGNKKMLRTKDVAFGIGEIKRTGDGRYECRKTALRNERFVQGVGGEKYTAMVNFSKENGTFAIHYEDSLHQVVDLKKIKIDY